MSNDNNIRVLLNVSTKILFVFTIQFTLSNLHFLPFIPRYDRKLQNNVGNLWFTPKEGVKFTLWGNPKVIIKYGCLNITIFTSLFKKNSKLCLTLVEVQYNIYICIHMLLGMLLSASLRLFCRKIKRNSHNISITCLSTFCGHLLLFIYWLFVLK